VILAAHGLTANHLHFQALADQLGNEVTLLAPDLRGRGRSNDIAGPSGMAAHADDMAAVLDHQGLERVTFVGHSMGAFAIVVAAHRHAGRVRDLVLVDGGLPLDIAHLAAVPLEELVRAIVGPALDRLRLSFPSREAYLDYWRPHPALVGDWNRYIEAAYTYDIVGDAPHFRSSVREDAVLEDSASQLRSGDIEASLAQLTTPVVLLRAPRGLFNQVPPLYPDTVLDAGRARLPQLTDQVIPDVNHYTILLTERGATAVAAVIRERLAA
jgi:pimeloyl-ACP methyl ester carboxylesterase